MSNVLFDVDGVLADFSSGFHRLAGLTPKGHQEQEAWDFSEEAFPKALQREAWEKATSTPYWWATLDPLVSPEVFHEIAKLRYWNQVVFGTNRRGTPCAQLQTQMFLSRFGLANSNVVLTKRKGDIAKALDIDYAIDDKAENAACLHWIADSRPCKSYILDRPYNRVGFLPKNVRRVASVSEFLEDVKHGR